MNRNRPERGGRGRRQRRCLATSLAAAALAVAVTPGSGEAGQTRRFVLDTARSLAAATASGMAVSNDGSLRPLPPLMTVADFEEPLGLALATSEDGTAYVGTGNPARVYRVRDGKKALVSELAADQVTALLVDPSGTVWASTAVPAALYRLPARGAAFDLASSLAEGNIWDLAWFRGGVVAAAGNPGRLLRLGAKGLELAVEIPDQHARCLAVSGGHVLIGTSGKGRVLRWTGDGPPGVLLDSAFTEIAALAATPTGIVYAAALTGDPTLGKPIKDDGEASGSASVTVVAGDQSAAPPAADKGTATSEILRILPVGAATTVHRFTKQLAGALAWSNDALVIGTGLEGELWQLVDGAAAQLDTVDAAQVVRLSGNGEWTLVQGPVRLLRRTGTPRGVFTSPPLDAGQPAQWGEAAVRGQLPSDTRCDIRFRSGATSEPDDAWSAWTAAQPCGTTRVAAPLGRYLQWKLDLAPAAGAPARIESVAIAYRQVNLPPEVKELTVHEPGEVFLKSPPPSERIVDVRHPDLSGIFTTLSDDGQDSQDRLGKRYYRIGYQSFSWKVEDPNGDPLRFTLDVQRQNDDRWWPVRSDLDGVTVAVDTCALPDDLYRFRLTATDVAANPDDPSSSSALSRWVLVDNSAPRVSATRSGDTWLVTVEDSLSPIGILEWSRDAEIWVQLRPEDGTLDGRRETARIAAKAGAHLLAVRAVDDHHNRATVALEEQP
jgi:hypothetical protein